MSNIRFDNLIQEINIMYLRIPDIYGRVSQYHLITSDQIQGTLFVYGP